VPVVTINVALDATIEIRGIGTRRGNGSKRIVAFSTTIEYFTTPRIVRATTMFLLKMIFQERVCGVEEVLAH
jgi:hypothetical protein